MGRWIDIDDDRNCYVGNDGEYETYNIDPDVLEDAVCGEVPHWISVEERLPEEYDSIFKRYYGTNKWNDSMFLKRSNDVPVIEVYEDGSKRIGTAHTCDGQWRFNVPIINREVVAWMELKLGDFEP